jgi:hemerythrin-like domain-containing protein
MTLASDGGDQMSNAPELTDTRDMKWVHDAFRRALADAPDQLACVQDGDTERAQRLASYLGEVLWLLHAHHDAEDELLYPLLAERVPQSSRVLKIGPS